MADKHNQITAPPTFRELIGTEMLTLYVTPDKVPFLVHKEVLCKKIPYFEKMFKGGFEEGTKNEATFPEDNTESFDLLLGWVYHDSIRSLFTLRKEGANTSVQSWSAANFYILAEKLCLSQLQDQIVNEYLDYLDRRNSFPTVSYIGLVYFTTPAGNPFRKIVARFFQWAVDPSSNLNETVWPTNALAKLMRDQEDLAEDVLTLIRTGVRASNLRKVSRCEFH